ncbi:MAG: glycoside hydrolase family 36 protein, partial [Bacteroidota bacterium]
MSNYLNPLLRWVFLLSFVLGLTQCGSSSLQTYTLPDSEEVPPLVIAPDSISVEGDLGPFTVSTKVEQAEAGLMLITYTFTSAEPAHLPPVQLALRFPSVDIQGYWNPKISMDKVNYYSSGFSSKLSRNAPVLGFYNGGLHNRITLALSDALNPSEFESYLKEEDVHFYPKISLFNQRSPKTTEYSITLRVDTRVIPYYQAIDEVASWWAQNPNYTPMAVPEGAKRPMYSTWYSYHQRITAEEIVAECKIAKSLGCGAVIVDDGWQTQDGNRGYAYTGDWEPVRIPKMKEFVEAVHAEGMQFLLWYSLPFMGENAKNHGRFVGKYLRHWESQGTYVLDPRYPEVREYIISTYTEALTAWNLDGFKLDFIGWFAATRDTELTRANGRDYASVEEATDALMTEITERLSALKPDILLEFRQPYIGPIMRKYGNMFRGVDAPNNAVANRVETTNLRIMAQNTAVHSDMFIWRPEETAQQAALQILNILYSVPQLSVRLAEIPEAHLRMIRFWFQYWNKNRAVLLDGHFLPSNPGANYPQLTALADGHQITTLYEPGWASLSPGVSQADLINATAGTSVAVKLAEPFEGTLVVMDYQGEVLHEQSV